MNRGDQFDPNHPAPGKITHYGQLLQQQQQQQPPPQQQPQSQQSSMQHIHPQQPQMTSALDQQALARIMGLSSLSYTREPQLYGN
jgi:hypothetical protein